MATAFYMLEYQGGEKGCPIFLEGTESIKAVADKRTIKPDLEAYLEAVLYYLENDDFKD